jgi:hypothetical protein
VTQNQIIEALLAFIAQDGATEDEFNELALELFTYQFENNSPFRQFAMQRERTPRTTRSWRDIPAVPINVFKDLTLSCCAPEDAERTFMTSGTTMGGVRGKSHHPTLAVYDASMTKNFKHRFMAGHQTIRMGNVLDEMRRLGKSYQLPAGSRLFDTGGFKGQSRELGPDDFYDQLSAGFGVARGQCINMYGMTELSTQFFDWGNETCPSVKSGPHWIRTRVINPLTGRDVTRGDTGVLAHCDLAHFNIVSTILTEDAGVEVDGGFLLLGRADGAEAQGCSMAVEEFLKAAQG